MLGTWLNTSIISHFYRLISLKVIWDTEGKGRKGGQGKGEGKDKRQWGEEKGKGKRDWGREGEEKRERLGGGRG